MLLHRNTTASLGTKSKRGLPPPLPSRGSLWDKARFHGPQLVSQRADSSSFIPKLKLRCCLDYAPAEVQKQGLITPTASLQGETAPLLQPLLTCLENIDDAIQSTDAVRTNTQKDPEDEKYNGTKLCHSCKQLWCTRVPWERCLRHAGTINSVKKEDTTPPGTAKSPLHPLLLPDKKFLSSQCLNKHVPKTLLNRATRSQPEKNKSYNSTPLPSRTPPPLFFLLLLQD